MKKYIIKICLFAILCVVMDLVGGLCFDFLKSNAKGGSTRNNYYILNDCDADIVILGSSRAKHHYIPSIIEDSLQLSCYNCSEEGNGILLANARYHSIVNRYTPKLIIYEVTPSFDYQVVDDNTRFLRYLKPYYKDKAIKDVVDRFTDPTTRYTLMSQMYQNNSSLLAYILDNISTRSSQKGYLPLNGIMDKEPELVESEQFVVDADKMMLLEDILQDCQKKDITMLFAISPKYSVSQTASYNVAIELAKDYGVPVFNYLESQTFKEKTLYQDNGHLNDTGANKFSKVFSHDLKDYISQSKFHKAKILEDKF